MKKIVLALVSLAVLGVGAFSVAGASRLVNLKDLAGPTSTPVATTPLASSSQPVNPTPPSSIVAQAGGQFVTVEQDHATTGTARIVTENGQRYIEFDAAFDTARGPDVNVVLHKGAEIPVNLTEGDYVTIAPLQSFTGAQRYLLAADVNLNDYQTVGIWCREFNVTFGYAPI